MLQLIQRLEALWLKNVLQRSLTKSNDALQIFERIVNDLNESNKIATQESQEIAKRMENLRAHGEKLELSIKKNADIAERISNLFLK